MRTSFIALLAVGLLLTGTNASKFGLGFLISKEFSDHKANFATWISKTRANYLTVAEQEYRYAIFAETEANVEAWNSNAEGDAEFEVNQFADKTAEERNELLGTVSLAEDKSKA